MFNKGYLYHLVLIKDSSSQTSTLESVQVVNELPIVFPEDLLRVTLKREIECLIYLLLDIQHGLNSSL